MSRESISLVFLESGEATVNSNLLGFNQKDPIKFVAEWFKSGAQEMDVVLYCGGVRRAVTMRPTGKPEVTK